MSPRPSSGLANTYGLMFVQSRIVQNVFPAVARLDPIMLDLGDPYPGEAGYTKVPHKTARKFYIRCGATEAFVDEIPDLNACKEAVVVGIGDAIRDTYIWLGRISPFIKPIPVSPLAFSCLFLTFSFYALMLLSFGMIKIASLMHFVTFTQKYIDIEKSTFVAISAYSCILLVPIFGVCFVFYEIVLT